MINLILDKVMKSKSIESDEHKINSGKQMEDEDEAELRR